MIVPSKEEFVAIGRGPRRGPGRARGLRGPGDTHLRVHGACRGRRARVPAGERRRGRAARPLQLPRGRRSRGRERTRRRGRGRERRRHRRARRRPARRRATSSSPQAASPVFPAFLPSSEEPWVSSATRPPAGSRRCHATTNDEHRRPRHGLHACRHRRRLRSCAARDAGHRAGAARRCARGGLRPSASAHRLLPPQDRRGTARQQSSARSVSAARSRSPPTHREDDFLDTVRAAKEHIAAGDVFQVVLSQRFSAPYDGRRPGSLPRAARRQPESLHVLRANARCDARRLESRSRSCESKTARCSRGRLPARARAARTRLRTAACAPTCSRTRRSAPSTSCSWTSAATTSVA